MRRVERPVGQREVDAAARDLRQLSRARRRDPGRARRPASGPGAGGAAAGSRRPPADHRLREPVPPRDSARARAGRGRGAVARAGDRPGDGGHPCPPDARAPGHPRAAVATLAGDVLRRRAAAREHRPHLRRRLPDPLARRAHHRARCREPPDRRGSRPRGARAGRGDPRDVSRCRRPRRRGHPGRHARRGTGRGMSGPSPARELVLDNACIVRRYDVISGAVRIRDGVTVDVAAGPARTPAALDLEGDWLLPGIVELHTDVLERHATPRPGVHWPALAAAVAHDAQLAAAGITTVLDSLALGYVVDDGRRPRDPRPLVEALRRTQAAGLLRCEHLLHLRCEVSTEHVLALFEPLANDPMVRLVSLMDHTPGQRQFTSLAKYREYHQGKYGLSDAQMESMIVHRHEDQERYGAAHRAAIADLCRKHGVTLASHDDATVAHVEEAVATGVAIAEFPTTLEAARAAHAAGLAVVGGAPNLVLGRSHSGNVSVADLAAQRLVDVLSSDYVPASALPGAFLLHLRHGIPLPEAVATVSATPARRVGLEDRGEISPGLRADLVRARLLGDLPVVVAAWRAGERIA